MVNLLEENPAKGIDSSMTHLNFRATPSSLFEVYSFIHGDLLRTFYARHFYVCWNKTIKADRIPANWFLTSDYF